MSQLTSNYSLVKTEDTDNAKQYLENDLGGSLDIIDSVLKDHDTRITNLLTQLKDEFTYTSIADNVTRLVHNFDYNPNRDEIVVLFENIELEKDVNYTENADNISINLLGWSINTGDVIKFKLYRFVR